mmetsp:Transcript_101804/g.287179  ORF Transcript_101804/g.287179 Transcript_101804/m.287179 type:complete len:336 (+) Transcript_101804:136-1143(+)
MAYAFQLEDFEALGVLAAAGMRATVLACDRGRASADAGRIPIAGSVVSLSESGALREVAVGCNGRIPPEDGSCKGYPSDHGETGAIRIIRDFGGVDWRNTVFATTLSPCIMCTRTLEALYARGLRSLVIAESKNFRGAEHRLDALPGFTIVRLTEPSIMTCMQTFARRYPWDWAADIGEVPPRASKHKGILDKAHVEGERWWELLAEGEAAVVDEGGSLSKALDGRLASGGNPCQAAVACAIGKAGSSVNLRECALVWKSTGTACLEAFGQTSLGACELFRPAALVTRGPVASCLLEPLRAVGVAIVEVGSQVAPTTRSGPCIDSSRSRSRSRER